MKNSGLKDSDYYYDEFGNLVFTASYHKNRGYCCQSGCRHCPFGIDTKISTDVPIELNLADEENISLEDLAEKYLNDFEEENKN